MQLKCMHDEKFRKLQLNDGQTNLQYVSVVSVGARHHEYSTPHAHGVEGRILVIATLGVAYFSGLC